MRGGAGNQIGTAGVESILGALSSGKCAVTYLCLSGERLATSASPRQPPSCPGYEQPLLCTGVVWESL